MNHQPRAGLEPSTRANQGGSGPGERPGRKFPGRSLPGVTAGALALLLLASASAAHAQTADLAWPEVTRESRPWTRWWWLGSAVDRANLTAELEGLEDAGFGGVEVTSIYGARGSEDAFIPYLSDRWVEMLLHSSSEARRLGMGLDMPPGSGWRMGGSWVPENEASASLRIRADTVRGGEVWRADLAGRRVDAVGALSSTGQFVSLARGGANGGPIEWRAPEGEWTVLVAETPGNREQVKRPAPGGAGNAVDVLSSTAVWNYLDAFDQRIAKIPDGAVRAFFHDSYEYTGTGSPELFETFRRRRGYDLAEHLPALAGRGDPDVVARVKADYRETMSEMLLENLLRPFTAWSHSHGAFSRNQAHGSPGNMLDLYAASDIPETEIFGPLGNPDSDPLVSKFASSAAHVAGKRLTSAEALTWLGEHFTVTLDQARRGLDQLFTSGVNHVLYHGTAYSPREAAWPGWLFYASTQFNPRNAIWRDLPALNRYVSRVQSVMQSGVADNDVLLYWPIHDSWHDPEGLRMDFRVHSPTWLHEMPLGEAARTLWDRGYGFDYVSDQLLANHVSAAPGRLTAHGAEYRVVLVPAAEHMPVETLQRLVDLARAGATVAFIGQLPEDVPGLARLDERRAALAAAKRAIPLGPAGADGVRQATVGSGRVLLGPSAEPLLRAAGVAREEMVENEGVRFIRRRHADGRHYFISHAGEQAVDGWVPLAVPARAVAIMDPMSGRTGLARLRTGASGRTEAYLQLEPGSSLILRTFDWPVRGEQWSYRRPAGAPVALRGTWSVRFVEGGPVLPDSFRTESLGSWTERGADAERFAGTARYRLHFDAPGSARNYLLDLGRVAESARVRLNGRDLGTLIGAPYQVQTGPLRRTGNELEIEVTSLSANRIRDLDRRGEQWKIFHDINFVGIDYKPFDASGWPVRPSGLLGPVTLQPLADG